MNKINSLYRIKSLLAWLVGLVILSSCVTTVENATDDGIGILIFGDSGYHPDYPDQEDFVEMFTAEGFVAAERQDWIDDKRPMNEFEPRPPMISPVTGRVTAASGLHQISEAMSNYCRDTVTCDFGVMLGDNIYPSGATHGADGRDDDHRSADRYGDGDSP